MQLLRFAIREMSGGKYVQKNAKNVHVKPPFFSNNNYSATTYINTVHYIEYRGTIVYTDQLYGAISGV